MNFSRALQQDIEESRALVRIGYPWWLRPWLARGVVAITLGRRIYVSEKMAARAEEAMVRLLRHELVHVRQVNRLGVLPFLWKYAWEFFHHYRRVRSLDAAYRLISFEVEAWAAEEESL
ncbi:MAG TPA: DUF4157 domain-containing protein [Thermoanaerobaculia bacterium]|jgi:hypothetical protein